MKRTHRFRALRNLLLLVMALFGLWWVRGFPLPALELELHRAERQVLAEESRIVWRYDGVQSGDKDILVGLTAGEVHTYGENRGLRIWPRSSDGPTLVLLPERTRYYDKGSYIGPAFLTVDPPEGAETARLTITLGEGFGDPVAYEMEGQKEDGLFFFQLREKQTGDSDSSLSEYSVFMDLLFHGENLEQYPYVLEFFDGGGHPLVDSTGR